MTAIRRQQGIAGGLVAIVIILVIVGLLATAVLSRFGKEGRTSDAATVGLARLAEALEAYAASSGRLPCPANPALATSNAAWGDEAVVSPGVCQFPAGTVPWRTLGARSEDALDPWGTKISYRVFGGTAGAAGSLAQPGGVSMVQCDTVDPGAGSTTPVVGVTGGLCVSDVDPTLRSTLEANFYAGKGFTVNDMGAARTGVAFVLVSHGPTVRGGYTANGTQAAMPMGNELANTTAGGPFWITAFSAAGTEPGTAGFFDDRLLYRTLTDLVARTKLGARDWPEPPLPPPPPATTTTSIRFDSVTVGASGPGSLGSSTLTIGGATIRGFTGGTETAQNLSYDEYGGYGGIGVMGTSTALSTLGGEWLRIDLPARARWFAVTFVEFAQYDFFGTYSERVELKFFDDATQVGSAVLKSSCTDGVATNSLASFATIDPGAVFNRIEITPKDAIDASLNTWHSDFLVGEIKACADTETPCTTALTTIANTCP